MSRPPYPFLVADQVLLWHAATRLAGCGRPARAGRRGLLEVAARRAPRWTRTSSSTGRMVRQWATAWTGAAAVSATSTPATCPWRWRRCGASASPPRRPGAPPFASPLTPPTRRYGEGAAGGLGSRHTPGTWTLGDIMGWAGLRAHGRARGCPMRRWSASSRRRSATACCPRPTTRRARAASSRHWFAWPGAALGCARPRARGARRRRIAARSRRQAALAPAARHGLGQRRPQRLGSVHEAVHERLARGHAELRVRAEQVDALLSRRAHPRATHTRCARTPAASLGRARSPRSARG